VFSEKFHHTISEHVPWFAHYEDHIIVLIDGGYYAMLELQGVPWQTHDDNDILNRTIRHNHTLCQIAHESITLTVYQYRGPASPEIYPPVCTYPSSATEMNLAYKAHLLDARLYQNRIFLGILVQPSNLMQVKNKLFSASGGETHEDRLIRLENTIELLLTELAAYRPRQLGIRIANRTTFSEIAETIVWLTTGVWRPIGLTTGNLGDAMFSEHIDIPHLSDTIHYLAPDESRYAMMLGVQRLPGDTHPMTFARTLTCSYQCTVMHAFRFLSTTKVLGKLNTKEFLRIKFGDTAKSQTAELQTLKDLISSGNAVMGDYACAVLVFAPDEQTLRRIAPRAWTDLAESGAKITREMFGLRPGFLSMIPGNAHKQIRGGWVTSLNMVNFAPMHGFPTGPERSHWGAPIALFRSPAGTVVYFHWQAERDDTGNALITGETGSGKTTLVAFLLTMTTGRAKVIGLDHKRGWDFLFRKLGGSYTVIGAGTPSFAPLKTLEPTERNLAFLYELIRGCILSDGGVGLTPDEEMLLARAIRMTMTELPPDERSLWELRPHLGVEPDGAGARLEKWCRGRELGWVLDAEHDSISLADSLCGIDTTALLDNERATGPALTYLFYRINLALDGKPTLIAVDEGWKTLNHAIFGTMIDAQIRTIRSKNGVFVFITQGAEDIAKSGLSGTLVQQCPTQIHLPSPRATESDYVDGLKRTHGEFAALRDLLKGSRLFLLCQGRESTIAQLPLDGLDDIIDVLSARENAIRAFDAAVAQGSDTTEALATIRQARQAEDTL